MKEIDQGSMVGSVEKHRRHLCIGQPIPAAQWPSDVKDLQDGYIKELMRVLKEKKEGIGYAVKLTSASVSTAPASTDAEHAADWYLFPDQIKLSNVRRGDIEHLVQKLFVDDQSIIQIKDKDKSIDEQLKEKTTLPVLDREIACERLPGVWILVCCHYQRDQRCGR